MKNKFLLKSLAAAAVAVAMYSCQEPSVKPTSDVASEEVKPTVYLGVSASVPDAGKLAACKGLRDVTYYLTTAAELNLVSSNVYCLCGDIRVGSGNALNIAAGTLIRGMKASAGSLTIERGAQINATGTAANPIVFTSSQDINTRAPMDWGGVIILGNAQVNQASAPIAIEGFPAAGSPAGAAGPPVYGRTDSTMNAESSGRLQFARIEFGGVPLPGVQNSEKNGLTLGAVGRGTIIDHVQVSYGGDDGFEWFGGVVRSKYLISHRNLDDDFDTDFGFSGKVQFGLASRDPQLADISGSNGFESDNDATGSISTPRTSAQFSNFTIIGPIQCPSTVFNSLYQDGLHLRRRTQLEIYNSVIVGWERAQVFIADANVQPHLEENLAVAPSGYGLVIEPASPNNWWTVGPNNTATTANAACSDVITDLNSIYRKSGLPAAAWNLTGVNFTPLPNNLGASYTSPLLATGMNASTLSGWFTTNRTTNSGAGASTYYVGARRAADDNGWSLSSGWVNYQPESLSYENDGIYN